MQTLEPTLEALANRVSKLEAQNRRLKKAGIASVVVAAAVFAMGQAPAKKVIEANEFVLQGCIWGNASDDCIWTVGSSGQTHAQLLGAKKASPSSALGGGDDPSLSLAKTRNH